MASGGMMVLTLAGGQIVLVWMAVLAAGVATVKMGDKVLAVAELVPDLRLKDKGYARRKCQHCSPKEGSQSGPFVDGSYFGPLLRIKIH